jgi:hypothetical protein
MKKVLLIYLTLVVLVFIRCSSDGQKYSSKYFNRIEITDSKLLNAIDYYQKRYYSPSGGNMVIVIVENHPVRLKTSFCQISNFKILIQQPSLSYFERNGVLYFVKSGLERLFQYDSLAAKAALPINVRNKEGDGIFDPFLFVYEKDLISQADTMFIFSNVTNDFEHDKPILYRSILPR